ncbi:PEP/pyruvate-binding domain-containing protein [Desulfoplanes sp.]
MSLRNIFSHWTYETFPPGAILRSKYNAFARLMREDETCLGIIAEIEELHSQSPMADWSRILYLTSRLDIHVRRMLEHLQRINPVRFMDLMDYVSKTSFYMHMAVSVNDPEIRPPFVFPLAGAFKRKKHANDGSAALSRIMAESGSALPIPQGFVISSSAYHYFIEANDLRPKLDKIFRDVDLRQIDKLKTLSRTLQDIILEAPIPAGVADAMEIATLDLVGGSGTVDLDADPRRTPATRGLGAHHVRLSGITLSNILRAWKECVRVKYRPECIAERIAQGLADSEAPMVVMAQVLPAQVGSGWFKPEPTEAIHSLPERTRKRDMVSIVLDAASSGPEDTTMLLARDEGHRVLLNPDPPFMSPRNAKQLTIHGLAIQELLAANHTIDWVLDTRHRFWITSVVPDPQKTSVGKRSDKTLSAVGRSSLPPVGVEQHVPPERIKSMYDMITFARDRGIEEMFALVNRSGLGLEGTKLLDDPPARIWVLNLADGLFPTAVGKSTVDPNELKSIPMWALWFGIESTIASKGLDDDTADAAAPPHLFGHAILSRTYLHMSIQAGPDFAEIDTVCGPNPTQNHIGFRYKSTGFPPPAPLIVDMKTTLEDYGFATSLQGNMLEGRCRKMEENLIQKRLAVVGKLVAAQRDKEGVGGSDRR